MSVKLKTRIMVWGRAAHRCSFPDCNLDLVVDEVDTDDPSLIGEICHIVGQKPDGPRGNHPMPLEQRDLYSNLLLICNNHHKVVDDNPSTYTTDMLQDMKRKHEEWYVRR